MASNVWLRRPNVDESKFKVSKTADGKFTVSPIAKTVTGASAPTPAPKLGTSYSNTELPNTFVGESGVVGGWKEIPATVNPNNFEFAQNRAGRWFAKPVDDLTGINDNGFRQSIRSFDRDTAAQSAYLDSRVAAAGADAKAQSDASAARMSGIANLMSTGPSGNLAAANAAMSERDNSRAEQLASDAARTRAEQYRQQRADARWAAITGQRGNEAKAEAEAQSKSVDRALRVRGQNMQLLGQKLVIGGQNERAAQANQTKLSIADQSNQTKLRVEAARLEAQAAKAANSAESARLKDRAKAKKARADKIDKQTASAGTDASKLFAGVSQGENTIFYTPVEAYKILRAKYRAVPEAKLRQIVDSVFMGDTNALGNSRTVYRPAEHGLF